MLESELLAKLFGISVLQIGQVYGIILVLMSLLTFAIYGWDKRAAEQGTNRISEKSLHLMELLGGWPGAIFGQQFFRHKTQKTLFRLITYSITVLHVVGLGALVWFAWN